MDLSIAVGKNEIGKVKYEALPAFRYFFNELGFDVNIDTSNQSIKLTSALEMKKIVVSSEENKMPYSFRKHHLERNVLKQIKKYMEVSGAEVFLSDQKEGKGDADLHLKLSLLEVPSIKVPLLEVTYNSRVNNQKLVEVIQSQCKKTNMKFKLNEPHYNYEPSMLKIQIMSPIISDYEFWNGYGENYAITITSGIFASFIGKNPLSFFSMVPVENLVKLFDSPVHSEVTSTSVQQLDQKVKNEYTAFKKISEEEKVNESKTNENKTKKAEVYFDYHLLVDEGENQKIQLLGSLHIKNIGTEILRNPVICLKSKPSKNIKITGQLIPQVFAQTKGVLNQGGSTKGWGYMYENWLEEFEDKGELWICPIHSIEIAPDQSETLSNLQISFQNSEQKTVRVEAFVFFPEDNLEFKSNNQILLSLLEKVNSDREKN